MDEEIKFGRTDFFMLLAVIFWAVNFPIVKIALRQFKPLAFNGIRLSLASFLLLFILFLSRESWTVAKSDMGLIIFLSLIGNTIFQMFFIHGLNWTSASNTSILMAMTPVFVALFSSCLKLEKIHWAAWLGIAISFVGFYLVITKQPGEFQISWGNLRGEMMILAGNICWAVYTVLAKPLLDRMSPLKLTAITMAIGTMGYLPFSLGQIFSPNTAAVPKQGWAALFYSGLFALVISYVIWYASVKRVGNTKTAIYSNITPIITVILSYFFLGERLTFLQGVGALIILVGVYLTRAGYRLFEKRKDFF